MATTRFQELGAAVNLLMGVDLRELEFQEVERVTYERILRREQIATGGGLLHSPTWTRIMADVLGRPVKVSDVEEASSRGAALLALEGLGELEIEASTAPFGETIKPDPEHHEIYRKALARQRRLYSAVLGE